jgi:hypothetical protein
MMIYQIHPNHGHHIAYSPKEAEHNNKHGWVTVTEDLFMKPNIAETLETLETLASLNAPIPENVPNGIEENRDYEDHPIDNDISTDISTFIPDENIDNERMAAMIAYQQKFGKKPHHRMLTETILKAIENDHGH